MGRITMYDAEGALCSVDSADVAAFESAGLTQVPPASIDPEAAAAAEAAAAEAAAAEAAAAEAAKAAGKGRGK